MITVEESRRIRDAQRRIDDAATEWSNALRRGATQESVDDAAQRWLSARADFDNAVLAVTDWSTAPAPAGKT